MRKLRIYSRYGASVYSWFFIYSEDNPEETVRVDNNVYLGGHNLYFSIHEANDKKLALHTELAQLKYFNWSISEGYSLPVGLRQFHLRQIQDRLDAEKEASEKARGLSSPK